MTNSGFKGSSIRIEKLEIKGSAGGETASINVTIQFVSDEGTVHAVARHELPVTVASSDTEDLDGLYALLQSLVKSVTTRLERIHFTQPKSLPDIGDRRGIAEALSSTLPSTDEPKAKQG